MTTRKHRGGDINRSRAYENIISIGYEFETSQLTKLTLRTDLDSNGKTVKLMMNTDTARADVSKLTNEIDETSDEFDDMIARQEELIQIDAFNNSGRLDKNISFAITNDISEPALTKYIIHELNGADDETDYDKNARFILKTESETYPIQFVTTNPIAGFTSVEWVCTHYNPPQLHKNIILDTFFNSVSNILTHVAQMVYEPAQLIFVNNQNEPTVITRPTSLKLYHLPNTNMYYMQTYRVPAKVVYKYTNLDMLDACIIPQMTFACKIEHVYGILHALSNDRFTSRYAYSYNIELASKLKHVNSCVDKLIQTSTIRLRKPEMQKLRGCMFLILWKLHIYYNTWLTTEASKRGYFKNWNTFNARHLNYDFYKEIKQLFMSSMDMTEAEAIEKTIQLFLQPTILELHMAESGAKLRKGVFRINNVLDIENAHYGDPAYSLLSYFHFFENPAHKDNVKEKSPSSSLNSEEEEDEDDDTYGGYKNITFYHYDWLEYANIDAFSAKMEYKNDIVLVEVRHFYELLLSYIHHIADENLKVELSGVCNPIMSLRNLSDATRIYKNIKTRKTSKTRKTTR